MFPLEHALLDQARAWPHALHWRDLTVPVLAELARAQGADFAAAVVQDRLQRDPKHRAFLDTLAGPDRPVPQANLTVVVAPGALYRERPETGAGGERVLEHAAAAGFRTHRLDLVSFGLLHDNARRLVDQLQGIEGDLVLVTLSKAAAEVKLALADPRLAAGLGRVRAWVNLSGLPFGTPLANWLLERPLHRFGSRLLFWWYGHPFAALHQLRWGQDELLDADIVLPANWQAIHIVGVPLAQHLSCSLARTCTARTAAWGPTDGGAFLLGDLARLPGRVIPLWGCDHYLRPAWDVGQLIRAVLRDIVRALGASTAREIVA